ncbi:DUF1589 domain-containing protein [Streptomyces sp. NPDC091682]|uniref:DUF1589 domain-containing protein n=1 Tax=unclassified Streptomyces TaxID=2593676 RepID=UPI003814000F
MHRRWLVRCVRFRSHVVPKGSRTERLRARNGEAATVGQSRSWAPLAALARNEPAPSTSPGPAQPLSDIPDEVRDRLRVRRAGTATHERGAGG